MNENKEKNRLTGNLVLKLIALVMGFLIWLMVTNSDDPTRSLILSNVPITIVNEDSIADIGKVVEPEGSSTVTLKVTERRSVLNRLARNGSDFYVEADLENINEMNTVPLTVNCTNPNVTWDEISINPSALKVKLEDKMEQAFVAAVTTVLDAISKIRDTSTAHERVCVVEVMGRHCGDIALYAGLTGGAEAVVLPEVKPDVKEICRHLITSANSGKMQSIIVIAEGAEISSDELVRTINKITGRDVKRVVLSYLQRGGSPTMSDRMLASLCAAKAINLIEEESESKAIGILDGKIIAFDLAEALEQKREFKTSIYNLIGVLGK